MGTQCLSDDHNVVFKINIYHINVLWLSHVWFNLCIIRQYIHSKTAENHLLFSNSYKWFGYDNIYIFFNFNLIFFNFF